MIVLDATTDNVQVVLGGAVTTNQLRCVASWRDITTTAYTPGRTITNTNNGTDVNIVPSPAASTQRVVDFLSVYNSDTVSATVTIKFDSSGTEYTLWSGALATGECITYTDGDGWKKLSASGKPQLDIPVAATSVADGVNVIAAGTRTATTVGTVIFSDSNNVTFGLNAVNGSIVTASISQTNQQMTMFAAGNTTQVSASTTNASSLIFRGEGVASVGLSGGSVLISVPAGGGGGFTGGMSTGGNTSGTTGLVSNQLVFVGGNNITLSQSVNANSATLTISAGAGGGGAALSAGSQSGNTGTIVFANSNNATFGMSGSSQVTLSAPIRVSAGLASTNATFLNFVDGSGVQWGLTNGNEITASVQTNYLTSQSNQAFSADASSTFQTLSFQDSNGVSFSNNAGALRVTHALQFTSATSAITSNALNTSASRVINIVAATNNTGGGTASLSSNVSFSAANGLTFYTSAGNAVVGSHNALTSQSNQQITAYAASNTLTATSGTYNASSMIFAGAGVASVGITNGSVLISVPAGGGVGDGGNVLQAGTRTATTLGTVVFSEGNGVTFGLNAVDGSVMTATVKTDYLTTAMLSNAATISNIIVSAGLTSNLLSSVEFRDSNGISFGINAGTVTASHNGLTSQSNQALSGSNGSFTFQTALFSNANGISFGTSAGPAITASHNALTTARASNDAIGLNTAATNVTWTVDSGGISLNAGAYLTTQSAQAFSADASSTFQTLAFLNSNGVSFSNTVGSLRVTHDLQHTSATSAITSNALNTSAAFRAVYDGANSVSTGTLRFTNANGVTFTLNGQTLSASVVTTYLTSQSTQFIALTLGGNTAGTTSFHATNNASLFLDGGNNITLSGNGSTVTISAAAQTNQQMTMFATGNTTRESTGTSNASSLVFRGSGAASVGITNGSVLIDVAAGAAAITQSIGMSTQTAGGGTGGTTGYATGDDVLYHFAPGSNITMSQSINGASGTLSIYGPAAGAGVTLSGWQPFARHELINVGGNNATMHIHPLDAPSAFQFNNFGQYVLFSNAVNSSGSLTLSIWACLYTRNGSTLSSYASQSTTIAATMSGTAGSYSLYGGNKILPMGWTTTIPAGNYWLGMITRSTTGGANMSISPLGQSQIVTTASGFFGFASNTTNYYNFGEGIYSVSTAGIPDSFGFTDINAAGSQYHRLPAYVFLSDTF